MPVLDGGWRLTSSAPGAVADPAGLGGESIDARVPGTVAGALAAAGRPEPPGSMRIDELDWWFSTSFPADPALVGADAVLRLEGVATVFEVYVNGALVLEGDSMFPAYEAPVGSLLRERNELAVCCRALAPLLGERRGPRARWRTKVADRNLRFHRTALLGRAPGFAPGPPVVGPWGPVRLERAGDAAARSVRLRTRIEGGDGVLTVSAPGLPVGAGVELSGPSGTFEGALDGEGRARIVVPDVARWWPHTHGEPALHEVRVDGAADLGRVGFRHVAAGPELGLDAAVHGLDLHVNGVRTFARGAVWTPVDPVTMAPDEAAVRAALEQVRDAGMNLLRIPGTSSYESRAFHALCAELGIMVWQDFMFANFDYPIADDGFRASVEREAREALEVVGASPATVALCGNSEVEQQVAMLGLDPEMGRGELFGELLPSLAREAEVDAVYVPSAPCGPGQPMWPAAGVANYFGVGGYRRPLSDVRRAAVRFASECLAFANVPDADVPDGLGVPRDVGADWDFADVRDHYLGELYGVDVEALREDDRDRYLDLSRAVTGEAMAEVFGEWRRRESPCGGGLVLWLRDLTRGSGWGVVDSEGLPKVAYHHLRRALAPVAVWTTDEGLGGIDVHVANDRPRPLRATLRVSLYRDLEQLVDEATAEIEVEAHDVSCTGVEAVLGHFRDVAWTYRFGPPAQDAVFVRLERGEELLAHAARFPVGPPAGAEAPDALGLEGAVERLGGTLAVRLRSRRVVHGLRVRAPGFVAADDAFTLEPGRDRLVALDGGPSREPEVELTALNMRGAVRATAEVLPA